MRIITCSKNSITSNLSKFIFSIIKDLKKTIKNCMTSCNEFIKHISQVILETNDKILRYDIKDLYTNVPLIRSVDIVINWLNESENFIQSSLIKTDVKQIYYYVV